MNPALFHHLSHHGSDCILAPRVSRAGYRGETEADHFRVCPRLSGFCR